MKFSDSELLQLRSFFESPRVLISSHVRPDPDAIGSVLALREAVLQCGGTPVCIMEDACPTRCKVLFGANEIHVARDVDPDTRYDDVIIVDSGNRERIGDVEKMITKGARVANVDHHISNSRFGNLVIVDTDAAASGELLFELFTAMRLDITVTMATNMLAGLLTDTGRFRHSNTSPSALRVAANLVELGASLSTLTEQLYFTIPAHDIKSTAQILSTLELHANGQISTMFVTNDYIVEDPDNLVDLGRAIEGVEVAVLFSEMIDERIRVSLRSKSRVNVSAIAESFGGGGHECAAGFRMYGTLRSVQARLLPSLISALGIVYELNGLILPIDKPAGWTSFDVVAKLRGGLKWKKVGHAGTLDPMATGMLIVMFGDCTTLSDEFMGLGKRYRGVVQLGLTTDSDDLDGKVLSESEVDWDERKIVETLDSFQGEILQRPPAVSAIRVEGKRSYKQARKGHAVELAPRPVTISEIKIVEMKNPFVVIDVSCGKGTYIRSIARDLGEIMGCGGTLAALRRTAIGNYQIENAWQLSDALKHPEFMGR